MSFKGRRVGSRRAQATASPEPLLQRNYSISGRSSSPQNWRLRPAVWLPASGQNSADPLFTRGGSEPSAAGVWVLAVFRSAGFSGIEGQCTTETAILQVLQFLTLSTKIAQNPSIMGSLGPEALKYESFEGKDKDSKGWPPYPELRR